MRKDDSRITCSDYGAMVIALSKSPVTKAAKRFWAERMVDTDYLGFVNTLKDRPGYYRKRRYDQNLWLNNGTWFICFTHPETKKRVRKSLRTKCKKKAKRLRDQILIPIGYYN